MLGCFIFLRKPIYLITDIQMPYSVDDLCTLFIATILLLTVSYALYTIPYVPLPIVYNFL